MHCVEKTYVPFARQVDSTISANYLPVKDSNLPVLNPLNTCIYDDLV